MVEWLPIPGLKEMAHAVDVMDRHSRRIFTEKQASLHIDSGGIGGTEKEGPENQIAGKDIMSLMCRFLET